MLGSLFVTVMTIQVVAVCAALYVLPLIIGCLRRVTDVGSVAVINILLGWTLVGWAVALAMALRSARSASPLVHVVQNAPSGRPADPPERIQPPGWAGRPGASAPREDPPPLRLPRRPAGPRDGESADPAERG
jgi:uncharacterized membrane protein